VKILAIEKEPSNARPEASKPYLRTEAARVWELYQSGIIREMCFRQDRTEAVPVLECTGTEEAYEILGSLPLVREGFIAFDVIPLRPYPGFTRLFVPD
jgi:hypothetical protein